MAFEFFENISIPVPNAGVDKRLLLALTCESKSETECMGNHLQMDFGSFRTKKNKSCRQYDLPMIGWNV